jgi:hypothetical protein
MGYSASVAIGYMLSSSRGHGISAQGILDLLKRIGRKRLRVVLAVPGEKFDNYGWQPWSGPKKRGGDGKMVMTKAALPENEVLQS